MQLWVENGCFYADQAVLNTLSVYLNYDSAADQKIIREEAWLPETDLLILDELHKMKGWKTYLKGVYDTRPEGMRILVTGSARLEAFRQQGDSLKYNLCLLI